MRPGRRGRYCSNRHVLATLALTLLSAESSEPFDCLACFTLTTLQRNMVSRQGCCTPTTAATDACASASRIDARNVDFRRVRLIFCSIFHESVSVVHIGYLCELFYRRASDSRFMWASRIGIACISCLPVELTEVYCTGLWQHR